MADREGFVKEALTGGGILALDGIASADIEDGDICFSFADGKLYLHKFNASSTDATASPNRIRPTDYTSGGVWEVFPIHDQLAIPVGGYLDVSGEDAPTGYLVCDGAAYSRSVYESLYNYYSNNGAQTAMYGDGDGSTTFNVPDWQGLFPRCKDAASATIDVDADARTDRGDGTTGNSVGAKQVDGFKSHTHGIPVASGTVNDDYTPFNGEVTTKSRQTLATGGNETRPVNMLQVRCVKY